MSNKFTFLDCSKCKSPTLHHSEDNKDYFCKKCGNNYGERNTQPSFVRQSCVIRDNPSHCGGA